MDPQRYAKTYSKTANHIPSLPPSFLRWSIGGRLVLAASLAALLWLTTAWALDWF